MPPVSLEPTISVGERPQTYALDRAAIGTGILLHWKKIIQNSNYCYDLIYPVLKISGILCSVDR